MFVLYVVLSRSAYKLCCPYPGHCQSQPPWLGPKVYELSACCIYCIGLVFLDPGCVWDHFELLMASHHQAVRAISRAADAYGADRHRLGMAKEVRVRFAQMQLTNSPNLGDKVQKPCRNCTPNPAVIAVHKSCKQAQAGHTAQASGDWTSWTYATDTKGA